MVAEAERHPPRLVDGEVEFHPAYHEAGRAVWATGIVAAPAREQASLFYRLAQAGEGGHACPVVCTAGLVRALRSRASEELRSRFLPPLLETDYDRAERGAQFLTERHGGSDVGANRVEAVPDGDAWRLYGEKWFCSVADADQFLVTARPRGAPEGTRGIGCFLVPRSERRLPDPAAEGQARHARARDGRDRVRGSVGVSARAARGGLPHGGERAEHVALAERARLGWADDARVRRGRAFAREREAFGGPIDRFPLVRENLAVMKARRRRRSPRRCT